MDPRKEAYVYRLSLRQIAFVAALSAALATVGTFAALRFFEDTRSEAQSSIAAVEPPTIANPAVATDEQNNIDIYRTLSPAVVNITTTAVVETFFGAYPQRGSGSGSIIDVDGQRVVLTNFHVVREALQAGGRTSTIEVTLSDNSSYRARVVGVDPCRSERRRTSRSARRCSRSAIRSASSRR
jgi:S1-C subfamily serine protease